MKRIDVGKASEIVLREVFLLFVYLAFLITPILGQFPEISGSLWVFIALVPYVTFQAFRYQYSIRRKEPFAAYLEFFFLKSLRFFGGLMALAGIALFIGQVWKYLKYGFWSQMPLLSWVPSSVEEWVINPTSWIGLSKIIGSILSSVSVPFALCLGGVPLVVLEPNLEELKQRHSEKSNDT